MLRLLRPFALVAALLAPLAGGFGPAAAQEASPPAGPPPVRPPATSRWWPAA